MERIKSNRSPQELKSLEDPHYLTLNRPGRGRSPRDGHPLRIYRPGRMADLLDVDPSTIWRWRRDGVLPPPVKIGGIEGWTDEQVRAILAQREPSDG